MDLSPKAVDSGVCGHFGSGGPGFLETFHVPSTHGAGEFKDEIRQEQTALPRGVKQYL